MKKFWIHQYEISQEYGGPEEGGWHFKSGVPTGLTLGPIEAENEEEVWDYVRALNGVERLRSEQQEYGYSSVLSHRSQHFEWQDSEYEIAKPFPTHNPHYE